MFLLFIVENAGKMKQSWSYSLEREKRKKAFPVGQVMMKLLLMSCQQRANSVQYSLPIGGCPILRDSQVRLDLIISTCSSCRCSCSLQGSRTSWPLRVLSNSMVLWYLSFFKHFYLSAANDKGFEVKQLMRLGTAIFKTADQTAVLLS